MVRKAVMLADVSKAFDDLLAHRKTREDIANWASELTRLHDDKLLDFEPKAEKDRIWRGISYLTGVDLRTSPTEYLHVDLDFWKFREKADL